MPSEREQRVADIVEEALGKDPGDCGSFLEESCASDFALRAEVESLLQFRDPATEFIEQSVTSSAVDLFSAAEEDRIGQVCGSYLVVREIGRGGLGTVYLAERADDVYRKRVALKLLRRGVDTDDVLRRFRTERQILAQLEHPNIARLLDGGTTEDGRPFLVMEHVDGLPLTDFCVSRALGLKMRLELFRKICGAVSHAHQNLVVHRDLKPSNIFVTHEGEPKLLDFGIAKLLEPEGERLTRTMAPLRVMTLDYASPEQLRGGQITTTTDVYSLGVILYELLTGTLPYHIGDSRPEEIARTITNHTPARPSTAMDENPALGTKNPKALEGDLDNIALMAMASEPSQRYASVDEFAEDIRCYLQHLPVRAHPPSVSYRAGKFVRRNKIAVIAAALVSLSLGAGVVATLWQARKARLHYLSAEQRFGQVRQLANSLIVEVHGAIKNLPGGTAARQLLVGRALQYLDSLAAADRNDPSLQRELAAAYITIGNVQGNPSNANLGQTANALTSYRKALAIADRLQSSRSDLDAARLAALAHEKIADVLAATGDISEAVAAARSALSFFQDLAASAPDEPAALRTLAISHLKLGDLLGNPDFPNAGDAAAAEKNYLASLQLLEGLSKTGVSDESPERLLGIVHERLGTVRDATGQSERAFRDYERSLAIREALAARQPSIVDVIRDQAVAHEKIAGLMLKRGETGEAIENYERSNAIFARLMQADPQNVQARHSLAISCLHWGDAQLALDRPDEAQETFERGLAALGELKEDSSVGARQTLQTLRQRLGKPAIFP